MAEQFSRLPSGEAGLRSAKVEDRDFLMRCLEIADTLPGDRYQTRGMETRENVLRRTQGMPLITDDNMATEWHDYDWRH
jgi:hypothetical protein